MSGKVLIISFCLEEVPEALDVLRSAGLEPVIWPAKGRLHAKEQEFITYWRAMPEKPIGILMSAEVNITAAFLAAAPELKAVSLSCAGYDHINVDDCKQFGVKVCNVPRQNYDAVSDFIWGQILCLQRRIHLGDCNIRQGKWVDGVPWGSAVSGKTLGIIGLGAIGQAVAKRAVGFDMDILASSTSRRADLAAQYGLEYVDRETLFRESDILVLCCPANEDTFHLINEETLQLMKPGAVIINPSRGSLVDTEALTAALRNKVIAGAALDVFETEPLVDSELFELDNVLLTPHMAGLADREICHVGVVAAHNMVDLLTNPDSELSIK